MLLDQVGELKQHVSSLSRRRSFPCWESLLCRSDCGIYILLASQGNIVGDTTTILRVVKCEFLAVLGVNIFVVDDELLR